MAARTTSTALQEIALSTVIIAGVMIALVIGRDVLVPIVLAILLSSLLSNFIARMHNLGTPVWLATAIALGSGFLFLFVVGGIIQSQFSALEEAWPLYVTRIETLLQQLSALTGQEFVDKLNESISKLDLGGVVTGLASSAGSVFNEIILIFLYTLFLLAERGTVAGKLIQLIPDEARRDRVRARLLSVSKGVQKYLSIKTLVSALTGLLTFFVVRSYEVNFSELIGLLAFILNFIPVIGSVNAVIIPVFLAIVQFDTLSQAFQLALLLGLVQLSVGNVVEPRLMGKSLNLSPFVVIVALTFWTTIWGIAGAFLSVPITATAVIIFRDIKQLRWIAVLLSADGNPDPSVDPKSARRHLSWPFARKAAESEEVQARRRERDALRAEKQAAETKTAPKRKRKPRTGATRG